MEVGRAWFSCEGEGGNTFCGQCLAMLPCLICKRGKEALPRQIEDVSGEADVVDTLINVYDSWIDAKLSDYNSAFYYQPRDYIAECYRQGAVLDD